MSDPFANLPRGHYGAILADPPWHWQSWGKFRDQRTGEVGIASRDAQKHYGTMDTDNIGQLPVANLAADNAVLFVWVTWPMLQESFRVIGDWGFEYKTCAFSWIKGDATQIEFFHDEVTPYMGLGYWTRSNSEVCLLATRGKPKRVNADVRQAIIAPRREHSRKPEGVHARIERLVAGPYLELFARQRRPNWDVWGNQTDKFTEAAV